MKKTRLLVLLAILTILGFCTLGQKKVIGFLSPNSAAAAPSATTNASKDSQWQIREIHSDGYHGQMVQKQQAATRFVLLEATTEESPFRIGARVGEGGQFEMVVFKNSRQGGYSTIVHEDGQWIFRKRDHGGILFIDLRDHYGQTQVVVHPSRSFFETLTHLKLESVVTFVGPVTLRAVGIGQLRRR